MSETAMSVAILLNTVCWIIQIVINRRQCKINEDQRKHNMDFARTIDMQADINLLKLKEG